MGYAVRMRTLSATAERLALFLAVTAFWAVMYLGLGRWNASRPAQVLPWDPVWSFPRLSVFVVPYLSAYVLPLLPLALLRDRAEYRRFAAVTAGAIAVSAVVFVAWPLTIPRESLGLVSIFDRFLALQYEIDRPSNLFPSLHVSLSFLFALGVAHVRPRWRFWMLTWATLIAVSTLFTRQHYLIDVIGGVLVAWGAWQVFLMKPKR